MKSENLIEWAVDGAVNSDAHENMSFCPHLIDPDGIAVVYQKCQRSIEPQ
jgi:hypothetical protein